MKRANALLLAFLMATLSLAGCLGGDDSDDSDDKPAETLEDWTVYMSTRVMIYLTVTQIRWANCITLPILKLSKYA